jgi:hypothetical protein
MRSRILVAAVALAALLPAGASAMPIRDQIVHDSAPAPAAPAPAPAPADGDGVVGYILVGLGGLALGAAGSASVRRSRRPLPA